MPAFGSPEREQRFFAAYDAVLARWPADREVRRLSTDYGTTVVQVCGPENGTPVLLLHGGGSTAASWFANVDALSQTCRVYAPDRPGEPGRGEAGPTVIAKREDWMSWLSSVLDGLGIARCAMVGHSYGAWMALSFAIDAPERVSHLALLDPTSCFRGARTTYNLRAVPLFVRPTAARMRSFLRWEAGGRGIDPGYLDLLCSGAADFPTARLVFATRPSRDALAGLEAEVLVALAAQSRQNDSERTAASARELLDDPTVVLLAGQTHHTLPSQSPKQLNDLLVRFLTS